MTRYYFDLSTPTRIPDQVGMNLQDLDQIRHEALRRAAEFASDIGRLDTPGVVVVTARDGAGDVVITVRLACMVEVSDRPVSA